MRRNKGGAIVNVASVRSVVAGCGNLQYDTTKAAVAGLTRALAADHPAGGHSCEFPAHSCPAESRAANYTSFTHSGRGKSRTAMRRHGDPSP
jgi:NAD(P)-dependent dehydrogenase (short-subunit alcohol dehydrogenase family)